MIRLWFAPESPRPWVLMRILLAAVMLWDAFARWPFAVELYSTAGFPVPVFLSAKFQAVPLPPLPTVILYSSLLVFLLMLLAGWHSRLCSLAVFGLAGWFALLDAAGTMTKYTAICLHLLLMMSFAQPGAVWSADAWIRRRRGQAVPLSPVWPRLLIRLLVASIYLGAAVTKIRLPEFATGDLLEFSLLDDAYGGRWLGQWLATKPNLLILCSFGTIGFELLFPALIWVPKLRRPMLFLAAGFHLTLGAMMHLEIFTPVMLAALCAFLKEEDFQAIQKRSRWLWPRKKEQKIAELKPGMPPWLNFGLFLITSLALVAGLAGEQYRRDAYGVFHRTLEVDFPQVDEEQAHAMIDAFEPPPRDLFHRIEIGSRLGYRHVYGNRTSFHPGEVVYVMARILQPHPNWDLEWTLIPPAKAGEDEPPAASYLRRLDASHAYASIGFRLKPEFPAGRYVIQLSVSERLGAKELIAKIPFVLIKPGS